MELGKVFDLVAMFSPFLLVSFIALLSVYNQDLKALVLMFGLVMLVAVLKTIGLSILENELYKNYCTLFGIIETPGTSTAVISFVLISLVLPMMFNKHYNVVLISVLFVLYFCDTFFRSIKYKCYEKTTTLLATIVGLSFGALYFFSIYFLGEDYYNLLYFNVSKNNRVQCDKLNTQQYECEEVVEDDEDGA